MYDRKLSGPLVRETSIMVGVNLILRAESCLVEQLVS